MRASLLVLLGIGLLGAVDASAQQGGSITIDGKTIALPYVQAWAAGHMFGMPSVDVIMAEKPLNDLHWRSSEGLAEGKYGVVLRLKPSLSMESRPEDAKLRYEFTDDIHVLLHAPGFQNWIAYPLTKDGINVKDFSVTEFTAKDGTVHAELAWTGSQESTEYSGATPTTTTATAWTANFTAPLVDIGPAPK